MAAACDQPRAVRSRRMRRAHAGRSSSRPAWSMTPVSRRSRGDGPGDIDLSPQRHLSLAWLTRERRSREPFDGEQSELLGVVTVIPDFIRYRIPSQLVFCRLEGVR